MNTPQGRDDLRVDFILEALEARRDVAAQSERLKKLGPAAVPRLLHHLTTGSRAFKTLAFFGLQSCWTRAAIAGVVPFLADEDAELRKMAAIVLVKGAGYDTLIAHCLPLLDDPRPAIQAFALDHVESERPDIERVRRLITQPALTDALLPHLPRYYSPDLIPALVGLLRIAPPERVPLLIPALIHTNADEPEVRTLVAAQLDTAGARGRAMAAEYLTWHGGADELAALRAAEAREQDPTVRAALACAAGLVATRLPRPEALADARARYRLGESFEPHWAYRGSDPTPAFVAARQARLAAQAQLFAIPGAVIPGDSWNEPCILPPAERFAPPHGGYDPAAKSSFGKLIEETAVEGFNGLVHVGDDTAWHEPHAGVHAIAAGVVRSIGCTSTWGVVVVIEHREPAGQLFCSLYAHLSPFVTVGVGAQVGAGQKIGAVGRSFTWENGGYAAHLHLGIHEGAWLQPLSPGKVIDVRYQGEPYRGTVVHADAKTTVLRISTRRGHERVYKPTSWLAGYISEDWQEAGDHGWLEPRQFLGERGVR